MSESLRAAQEHGWREVDAIDAAYRRGEIDQQGWHDAMRALIEPAYLGAEAPQGGSGHSGTPEEWRASRELVVDAVDRSGSFLDVGCANGLLMESVQAWAAERGFTIEPYGVDISAALVEVARARLPRWRDRIWAANAAEWEPPRRFSYVRTHVEYVPADRRAAYLRRLLDRAVEPGGRLIIGKQNERRDEPSTADRLTQWGFPVTGRVTRPHAHPGLRYAVTWVQNGRDG